MDKKRIRFFVSDEKNNMPSDEICLKMGKMLLKICTEEGIDKRDFFTAMECLSSKKEQKSKSPLYINKKYRTLERYSTHGVPVGLTFGDGYRRYSRTIRHAVENCLNGSNMVVYSDLRKIRKNWTEKKGKLLGELFDYSYEAEKNIACSCTLNDKKRKEMEQKEEIVEQILSFFYELDKPDFTEPPIPVCVFTVYPPDGMQGIQSIQTHKNEVRLTVSGDVIIPYDKYIMLRQIFKEHPAVIRNMQRPLYGLLHKLQKERRKICFYSITHKSNPL